MIGTSASAPASTVAAARRTVIRDMVALPVGDGRRAHSTCWPGVRGHLRPNRDTPVIPGRRVPAVTDSAAHRSVRGAEAPPLAPTEPTAQELHGVRRVDEYAWLRDSTSPRALAYLEAERAFYDRSTARLADLRASLLAEMSARLPAVEESVSWPEGSFAYRTRIPEGEQYEQLLRRPKAGGPEQLVLDGALLAAGGDYFELGIRLVSPDERLLAYSVDTVGDEVYALRFRDLRTGEDLPEEAPRTYYGGAWSADSSVFFYVVHDAAYRPYQVWRHRVGSDPALRRARAPGGRRALRGDRGGLPVRLPRGHRGVRPGHQRGAPARPAPARAAPAPGRSPPRGDRVPRHARARPRGGRPPRRHERHAPPSSGSAARRWRRRAVSTGRR